MDRSKQLMRQRLGVVGAFLGCVLLPTVIFFAERANDSLPRESFPYGWLAGILAVMALLVYSHIVAFGLSGHWKLTHARTDTLDERELQITHRATGQAYGIYAIMCLIMLYVFIAARTDLLGPHMSFVRITDKLLAFELLYVAHILPGAILAWRETPAPPERVESAEAV